MSEVLLIFADSWRCCSTDQIPAIQNFYHRFLTNFVLNSVNQSQEFFSLRIVFKLIAFIRRHSELSVFFLCSLFTRSYWGINGYHGKINQKGKTVHYLPSAIERQMPPRRLYIFKPFKRWFMKAALDNETEKKSTKQEFVNLVYFQSSSVLFQIC